jgi:glycolate oxidase iron-sulfur subunit
MRLVVRAIWLYQRLGLQALARRSGLLRLVGLARLDAFLPGVPRRFVVPRGEVYRAVAGAPEPRTAADVPSGVAREREGAAVSAPGAADRVAFFAGCVMATGLAAIDRATIRVLQRAGCDVVNAARQGCCGALNAHGGDLEGALMLARRNIAAFEAEGDAPVVVNSAGCGAMLKDYGHHLREDPAWASRAEAFSRRVRDVTEFLAPRLSSRLSLPLPTGGAPGVRVTYQDPCHLAHAQRITQPPRALLRAIPGLELCEMAERTLCCGSAGVYNVTNPRESRELQQRRLDHALATGADVIATANPGCLLQLRAGLAERGSRVQVRHVVELLDAATATPRGGE